MNREQIQARLRDFDAEREREGGFLTQEGSEQYAQLTQQLADMDTAAATEAEAVQANLPAGVTQDNLSRFVETDAEGNPVIKVDNTTNQKYYDIREDLAGGEITDRRLGIEGVNTGVTGEQLTTRADAREKGFQGDMRDDLASNFATDDRGPRGLVDPFGFDTALEQQADIIADPAGTMPAGSQYNVQQIQAEAPGMIMDPATGQVADQVTVNTALAQATDATNIATKAAQQYNAMTAFDQIAAENMQAQQLADDIRMVRAQQEEVDARSTVRGQLGILMSDFQGDQIPAWASASVRKAEQIMAARGLGASTIAGRSIAQAVQEAALPIAQRDAATFATFQQQNLSNRQQAELTNAANLLTVDIKNLDNRQQTAVLNTQNRVQARFTDQSEQNTARKINAASAQQNDQFYANFQQQVELTNAAQRTAISQYNAGQANALEQFRLQNQTQRQLFNAQNRIVIDQANTTWRRQVNTANTAAINAKNQFDAVNILNRSNTSLNNYMQVYRDQADYIFTASENEKTRAYNTAIAAMQAEASAAAGNKSGGVLRSLGGIFGNVLSAFAGTNKGAESLINLIPFLKP